jgi:hypothetical protein
MEMLFRKIEYWIEGDDKAQRRLDEGPWNVNKILKKSSNNFILFCILLYNIEIDIEILFLKVLLYNIYI